MTQRLRWVFLLAVAVWPAGIVWVLWKFVRHATADVRRFLFYGSVILAAQTPVVREAIAKVEVGPEGHKILIVLSLAVVLVVTLQGLRSPWTRGARQHARGRSRSTPPDNPYPTAYDLQRLTHRRP